MRKIITFLIFCSIELCVVYYAVAKEPQPAVTEWLAKHATADQKSLIVHMWLHTISNPNEKMYMIAMHSPEAHIYKTLPENVQQYLKEKFPFVCFDQECKQFCECYFKVRHMDIKKYKPTEQEMKHFNDDDYWKSRMVQ